MNLLKATLVAAVLLAPMSASEIASAEDLAPVALNSLPASPRNIASAKVENLHGQVIGHVVQVATDQSGKPAAISVAASDGIKVVAAQAASYDEGRNTVFTDLPMPQVASAAH